MSYPHQPDPDRSLDRWSKAGLYVGLGGGIALAFTDISLVIAHRPLPYHIHSLIIVSVAVLVMVSSAARAAVWVRRGQRRIVADVQEMFRQGLVPAMPRPGHVYRGRAVVPEQRAPIQAQAEVDTAVIRTRRRRRRVEASEVVQLPSPQTVAAVRRLARRVIDQG